MKACLPRILVLDGMWNKSLAAVRSLGRAGFRVTAGESTRLATALFSKYCSRTFVYPSPAGDPERFLAALESELQRNRYDAILPMEWRTQELLTSSGVRERIEQYAKIPFADALTARSLNDKARLARHASAHGIPTPVTKVIDDCADIEASAAGLCYPVLVKPRVSSGSRGIVGVSRPEDLRPAYLRVHRDYPFPIIQERIPEDGESYGVCLLLNARSEPRASFVYRKLRQYPVQGGPSTLRESARREDVRMLAEKLMQSIGWTGVAHVEFKIDPRDGTPRLIEVNPRFWGSLALAVEAGIDFPVLLYRMAMEGDIEPVNSYAAGVKCRWLIPGDILHFINNRERWRLMPGFFDFRIKDDIICLRDPMPTIGRLLSIFPFLLNGEMRGLISRRHS